LYFHASIERHGKVAHIVMHNESLKYLRCIAGNYYFVRRVPKDVSYHYSSDRISISLKTKSYNIALRARNSIAQKLEEYWLGLRLQNIDIPGIKLSHSAVSNGTGGHTIKDYLIDLKVP